MILEMAKVVIESGVGHREIDPIEVVDQYTDSEQKSDAPSAVRHF